MHRLIIEPGRGEKNYWRELFYILAWRDLAVRYKQTVIGIAWALIRPVLTGECDRQFPLGSTARPNPISALRFPYFSFYDPRSLRFGSLVFLEAGADVRGCDLNHK